MPSGLNQITSCSRTALSFGLDLFGTAITEPVGCWCGLAVAPEGGLKLRKLPPRTDNNVAEVPLTGSGGNRVTDDHVLLEAVERIDLRLDGGVREHLRGLLEGRGGHERLGRERGLRDTEQNGLSNRRLGVAHLHLPQVLSLHLGVYLAKASPVHDITDRQTGVSGVRDHKSVVQPIVHLLEHEAV